MTTTIDLQILCDHLTLVLPPPAKPKGINFIKEGSGRWAIARIGSGLYAVRAEYADIRGGTVTVKMENEITGFAPAVIVAMKFAISIAESTRHNWQLL